MKEYGWREDSFWTLAPDCLLVLGAEILVDWIKHAFITRFNEVPADVYKDYTISLAYDLAQTKQKYAFSDHSDIVSRRMGFIPLPLGVVMLRVVYSSVKSTNPGAWAVVVMAYFCLLTFRILGSIVILGKACDLIDEHKNKQETEKKDSQSSNSDSSGVKSSSSSVSATVAKNTTHIHSMGHSSSSENADPALFQLPREGHQKMFLFQNSCVDRSDVLLTKMNSTMTSQSIEEMVDDEADELQKQLGGEDDYSQTKKPTSSFKSINNDLSKTLGPSIKFSQVNDNRDSSKDADNNSLLSAAVSRVSFCKENSSDEIIESDNIDLILGESRVRSLSSPDLVTDGIHRHDTWDNDVVELERHHGGGPE